MVNCDTKVKNLSLLDHQYSNVEVSSYEEQIILSALESKVDERKKIFNERKTEIELYFKDDYQEVPKFQDLVGVSIKSYYGLAQHWIGIVESIEQNSFVAKLEDKTNQGTYEIATFEISEVSQSDRPLLSKGAIFYWSVGFATENGQIEKRSLLRFKRSVDFTDEDLDVVNDRAKYYNNSINWE
jgi:hypothetical protein